MKSPSLLTRYLEILSPCEKDHVLSFHGDENKKSALLSRALVRTTISRYVCALSWLFVVDFSFMNVNFMIC